MGTDQKCMNLTILYPTWCESSMFLTELSGLISRLQAVYRSLGASRSTDTGEPDLKVGMGRDIYGGTYMPEWVRLYMCICTPLEKSLLILRETKDLLQ